MRPARLDLFAIGIVLLCSCGGDKLPMTRDQIFDARMSVDTLYMTESGEEFVAPGNKLGVTTSPATNELAWAAWKCENPDCPEKSGGQEGRPFVFIWPNFLAYVDADGSVAFRQPSTPEDFERFAEFAEPKCPACLEIRDLDRESPEVRLQYQNWCSKYILPEAEEQLRELDEEYAKYLEREKQRSGE